METTTPLEKDQFEAYEALAAEAPDLPSLVTVREMAVQDTGGETAREIQYKDENGEVQTMPATELGRDTLKRTIELKSNDAGVAQHAEDWHTEEK